MDKKVVLIVEDEESLRHVLVDRLSHLFTIETASDGEEGLNKFKETEPDIVLADIIMPKMNGFQMVEKIREEEKNNMKYHDRSLPIIFLTNLSEEKGVSESQKKGIYDYLIKSDWTLEGIEKKIKDKLDL